MDLDQFSQRMVDLLPQLLRGFSRQEHNSLTRGEITLPQFSAMECLVRQGGCPMHQLALLLNISKPAATGLINRLLRQQLARRQHDTTDRRVVRVTLTAKGRRILAAIWAQKRRTLTRVFGQLTPGERAQYLRTLERVTDILSRQEPR